MFLQVSFPPRRLSYQTFAPFVRTIIVDTLQKVDDIHPAMFFWRILAFLLSVLVILGDPGAVSRAGRKVATKVLKHRRKSPWVPILTGPFPNGQANAGSWLGTKNALYYCAQSANSFSWVLFVSSYTTAIVSPHLPGSFTKLVRTRETFIFYFPNQKQRNYRWVE